MSRRHFLFGKHIRVRRLMTHTPAIRYVDRLPETPGHADADDVFMRLRLEELRRADAAGRRLVHSVSLVEEGQPELAVAGTELGKGRPARLRLEGHRAHPQVECVGVVERVLPSGLGKKSPLTAEEVGERQPQLRIDTPPMFRIALGLDHPGPARVRRCGVVDVTQPPAVPEPYERFNPTAGERERPADSPLCPCPKIAHIGLGWQGSLRLAVVVHDTAEEFAFAAQGQDPSIRLEEIESHSGPGPIQQPLLLQYPSPAEKLLPREILERRVGVELTHPPEFRRGCFTPKHHESTHDHQQHPRFHRFSPGAPSLTATAVSPACSTPHFFVKDISPRNRKIASVARNCSANTWNVPVTT